MASQQSTVEFILEQVGPAGMVSARKMFGEYCLYRDGKIVALVCDDRLFIKPTEAGRVFLGTVTEGSPYPGAKPCFLIEGDRWDDGDWLAELIQITAVALPVAAKKPRRKTAA